MKSKGTIMEIRENSMIIMAQDLSLHEVTKRQGVIEGMEIDFFPHEIMLRRRGTGYLRVAAAVAAAIILLFFSNFYLSGLRQEIAPPTAILTVDINPSVTLELNRQQQVVTARGLNAEARAFPLDDLTGADAKEAVLKIIEWAEAGGYIKAQEKSYILLSTVSLTSEADLEAELEQMVAALSQTIEATSNQEERIVLSITSNPETLQRAREEDISVGKLEIARQIDDSIDIDEIKGKRVKELITQFEEKRHPVFEDHPVEEEVSDPDLSIEVEKEHPVFEVHPGQGKGVTQGDTKVQQQTTNQSEKQQRVIKQEKVDLRQEKKHDKQKLKRQKNHEKFRLKKEKRYEKEKFKSENKKRFNKNSYKKQNKQTKRILKQCNIFYFSQMPKIKISSVNIY